MARIVTTPQQQAAEALRAIAEREGREPTHEETDAAVRSVRYSDRYKDNPKIKRDEDIVPYSLGDPYQRGRTGGITPYGESVMAAEGTYEAEWLARQVPEWARGEGSDSPLDMRGGGANQFEPLEMLAPKPQGVSNHWATVLAQRDAVLKGHTDDFEVDKAARKSGQETIQDALITYLESEYNEEFVDQGVLADIGQYDTAEQIDRVYSEFMRLGKSKETVHNLIALNLLRQGLGSKPSRVINQVNTSLSPSQSRAVYEQYRRVKNEEMMRHVDAIAAAQNWADTGEGVADVVRQDIIPFYGAITRVLGTRKFLPEQIDIGLFRGLLPGEIRQEIREWFVQAPQHERLEWVRGLEREWNAIRTGELSPFYTKYLVVENLMGSITDRALYNDDPTDTFDRIAGNLDVALGAVLAVGLIAKQGKSVADMFSGGSTNLNRQIAVAGGAREAESELDAVLMRFAGEHDMTLGEAAVTQLPRPRILEGEEGVRTNGNVELSTPNAERRAKIMEYTEGADTALLSEDDKLRALNKLLGEMGGNDAVVPMHRMSGVRGLDNGTGVELRITFGAGENEGWSDLGQLLADMKALDPHQEFRIVRRVDDKLEEVDITFAQIVDYYATGRVPHALQEFIEVSPELAEAARFFGGRRLSKVPSDELSGALESGWIPPNSPAYTVVRKELNDRVSKAGGVDDPLKLIDGEELFVQIDKSYYYNKSDIGELDAFRWFNIPGGQSTNLFGRLFPPNTKFHRLYEAANKVYHMEEASLSQFADILKPFEKLGAGGKQKVGEILEYVEDYARHMYNETGVARAPTTSHILQQFSHFDQKVLDGYTAYREAADGVYDVLNRRLYRDHVNRGLVTIRPVGTGTNYHGLRVTDGKGGKVYDPKTKQLVKVTDEEMAVIIEDGGGVLKLDFAIDSPTGQKFDRILVRKGEYEFGSLSKRPLNYFEGYHFRYYDDPYVVLKRTYGYRLNGQKVKDTEFVDEAIRMAGSHGEAFHYFNKGRHKYVDNGKGEFRRVNGKGPIFIIKPMRSVNNTEGTLYQRQALHREGRMFWDQRKEHLPDTHGNRARIADPTQAMQMGLAQAMRQATHEELFNTLKVGFKNEFKDLPALSGKNLVKMEIDDLDEIETALKAGLRESSGNTATQYKKALEIIRYLRSQLGTDSWAVPVLRSTMLKWAQWLDATLGHQHKLNRLTGWAQKHAMSVDPFARMRKIAYGAFMVLRPVRQLLLQSLQISMISGLAPGYVGTGKIFIDAWGLRRGLTRYRRAGFDDGWSDSKLAKSMGITTKEYKRLVEEFQRSGMLGSVNTHAYNASSKNLSAALPKNSKVGTLMYSARARGRQAYNGLARVGFEWGEMNNLTFSYLLAVRRVKKRLGYKKITDLHRNDWDAVMQEADALALAMTRPNKFKYQSGYMGTVLQFMSFQHRALVTFLGLNPALSKADTVKVIASTYLLWGGNMAGAEDISREILQGIGIGNSADEEIFPGVTLQDILAAGLVETTVNGLGRALSDAGHWSDLNIGILAPGAAVVEVYRKMLDVATKAPLDSGAFLGPFSNQASGFVKGMRFVWGDGMNNPTRTPGEKFMRSAEYLLKNTLPAFNDANKSWIAWQTGEWLDADGDRLDTQVTANALAARLGFGIRLEDEMAYYRMRTLHWNNKENVQNWIDNWRPVLKEVAQKWRGNEMDDDMAYEMAAIVHNLTESAPEGIRAHLFDQLINTPGDDGQSVADVVAEVMSSATANIELLLPYIHQHGTWTNEEKAAMQDVIKWIAEGYSDLDESYRDQISSELEAQGIE